MKKQSAPKTEEQKFAEAREKQWLWKTAAMKAMAITLVKLSLEQPEISANDLPPEMEQGGTGICGSITKTLASAEIIEKVGTFVGTQFYAKLVGRTRAGGHNSKLHVWRLKSRPLAMAFIGAKHKHVELNQEIMDLR
jgi:hypothetical protein